MFHIETIDAIGRRTAEELPLTLEKSGERVNDESSIAVVTAKDSFKSLDLN